MTLNIVHKSTDLFFQTGMLAMLKLKESRSTVGRFTDFNVWDSELTLERMRDFTSCKMAMVGNLISWNINDWTVTEGIEEEEYRTESVDFSSLCYTTPRLTAFPQLLTLRQS